MTESTYPASHILNPRFVYVPAASSDVRETFRRAREQLAPPANVKSTKQQKAKEIP